MDAVEAGKCFMNDKLIPIRIPDIAISSGIEVGDLVCFVEGVSEIHLSRSEFSRSIERQVVQDQKRTVLCIEVGGNVPSDDVFDRAIRSHVDLIIIDILGQMKPDVLGTFCEDLKSVAKQFRARIFTLAKIYKKQGESLSLHDIPNGIQESADFLLVMGMNGSEQNLSVVKSRRDVDCTDIRDAHSAKD